MSETSVLQDLVVVLVASLFVLAPSRRLRIPPAVGFLITGVVIGPGALGLVREPQHVEVLAEIGVSVLLFVIGLEFSFARLREIGRAFLLAGPLQVLGTVAVIAGIVLLRPSGTAPNVAVFAGMLVALSSTAMVLPLLIERGVRARRGRRAGAGGRSRRPGCGVRSSLSGGYELGSRWSQSLNRNCTRAMRSETRAITV